MLYPNYKNDEIDLLPNILDKDAIKQLARDAGLDDKEIKLLINENERTSMVQQQVKTVWQHMVGVMCLNLTYRKQVKEILPKLFKKYPNPKAFAKRQD